MKEANAARRFSPSLKVPGMRSANRSGSRSTSRSACAARRARSSAGRPSIQRDAATSSATVRAKSCRSGYSRASMTPAVRFTAGCARSTAPAVGARSPAARWSRVLFPVPLAPTSATTSPAPTSSDTSSTTGATPAAGAQVTARSWSRGTADDEAGGGAGDRPGSAAPSSTRLAAPGSIRSSDARRSPTDAASGPLHRPSMASAADTRSARGNGAARAASTAAGVSSRTSRRTPCSSQWSRSPGAESSSWLERSTPSLPARASAAIRASAARRAAGSRWEKHWSRSSAEGRAASAAASRVRIFSPALSVRGSRAASGWSPWVCRASSTRVRVSAAGSAIDSSPNAISASTVSARNCGSGSSKMTATRGQSGAPAWMETPSISTDPDVGGTMPARMRSSEVLPEPFAPRITRRSPG